MKQKLGRKLLSFLLTLAMVVGLVPGMSLTAYADNNETLLTTITPTGDTTYSETTSGVVTVSHDNDFFMDPYGWVWQVSTGTLSVSGCKGYTITKCIFKQSDYKSPFTVSSAPFELHFDFVEYMCICRENSNFDGVSSIEVYGYASKAAQTITAEDVTVTYGDTGKAVSASVTDPKTGGGTISYAVKSGSEEYIGVDASTGALTIKKVPADGIAYVTVTAAETDTHDVATKDVAVIVSKADPLIIVGQQLSAFVGQTLADVALPTAKNGVWSWKDDTTTTLNELGMTTHFAKFTPNDTNNYNTLDNLSVQIQVSEKQPAVPATVTANNRTYDGTEKPLVNVDNSTLVGGTMQYALGENATTAPDASAFTASIPAKTDAGTYYVWYKVVGDANHNDSTPAYVEVRIATATVTLTYDANGGFNAPAAQTGRSDSLTIPRTIPTMYTGDSFRVTLDYNDGSGSKSIMNTLHRYYYNFTGWNTERDGSGISYQPGAAYTGFDSVTLYAQWRAGGEASAPVQLPTPKRDGYDFVGWARTADAETGVSGRYVPISDVTLYAVWTLRQYTLTFDTDGGTEIAPVTGVSGTEIPAPADPEKFGFLFAGWDREIPATMPDEDITIKALWKPTQFGTADFILPAALTEIEEEAFEGAAMMAVYVPDTVETIGANAFKDCELLWKIRLPKDCEIDETAFDGCTAFLVYATAGGTVEAFCAEQESIIFVPEVEE